MQTCAGDDGRYVEIVCSWGDGRGMGRMGGGSGMTDEEKCQKPVHPGEVLDMEFLKPRKPSQSKLARDIGQNFPTGRTEVASV